MDQREFNIGKETGTVWEREQPGMWRMMMQAAMDGEGFFPLPHDHICFENEKPLTAAEAAEVLDGIIKAEMRRALEYRAQGDDPYYRAQAGFCWKRVNEKRRERDILLAIAR